MREVVNINISKRVCHRIRYVRCAQMRATMRCCRLPGFTLSAEPVYNRTLPSEVALLLMGVHK